MSMLRLLPSSGNPIEITKEQTVMGRDPACDMVVADGSISRRHARIEKRGSGWAVVDQGSANGTFVDSQRTAESELHNGQELRLGAIAFKVEIEGEADDLGATIASLPAETLLQAAVVAPPPARPVAPPPRPVAPPPPPPRPASPAVPPPPAPPRPAPPRAAAPPPPPPPARPAAPPRPGAPATPVRSMGAPPPAKQGKGPLFWILMGCCGCLLLVLLGLGGFVGLLYMNTQPAATAVQAMLKDAKGSQLDQAYLRCSEGYRARVSREEFEALIASHPALRQNADATFMSRSNSNGVVTFQNATLVADDKEQESVTFRVVQEGGEWKIDDIVTAGPGTPKAATSQPAAAPSVPEAPAGGLTLMAGEVRKTRAGDAVKVEINVIASGVETRGGDADMVEDVETHGPDGRRIPNLSKDGIEHFTGAPAAGQHTFETTLTVDSNNPPGTYRVLLTVHDKLSGSEASQEVTFELP